MGKGLLVIGAGGNGKVAADIALSMGQWSQVAFVDDTLKGQSILNLQVIGGSNDLLQLRSRFEDAFISIAHIETYFKLKSILLQAEYNIPTLIHPTSFVAKSATVGKGTMVCPKAVVHTLATVDADCIINTGAIVEHDCVIKARTHIAPGAVIAGNVEVGQNCWVGLGARINENLKLCDDVKIGTGGVVISEIMESGTYVGVPARKLAHD